MKIGVIGCGFIAETHAQSIRALGHNLEVVVSRNLEKVTAFAKKWKVPHYGINFELAIAKCDCIHICTPPMAHYQYAKAVILAKKHILCEKPLCIHPAEASELFQLAKEQGVIAAVNFNVRFHEACKRARKSIGQKAFGKIRLIHGSYLQEFHAERDFYSWRYQRAEGGNMRATTEIGAHWIDLVRYWTGLEVIAVAANFANFQPQRYLDKDGIIYSDSDQNRQVVQVESEDAATILFKFSNGAIGNVVLSEVSHGKSNQLQLTVTGEYQSISWNNEHPYQLLKGEKNKGIQVETNPFGDGFNASFTSLFKEFYQAIASPSHSSSFPTFKDGYINALICQAIYKSAQQNSKWVPIEKR